MNSLTDILDACDGGLRSKDADMIPACFNLGGASSDGESDFGKAIR